MKVGILTQPLLTNYGGILQNYALQQILIKLGHQPVTLDYMSRYTPVRWILGKLKSLITRTPHDIEFPRYFRTGQENLNRFIHTNINKTRPYNNLPLNKFARHLDVIIVGSDQVWRPICNVPRSWLYEMFFESIQDLEIPKIAYGASFGSEVWEYNPAETERCSKLIQSFRAISLREVSGTQLCREFLKRDAQHVLDPTMLLTSTDYERISLSSLVYNKPTLFAYLLDQTPEKIEYIQRIAKEKQLNLFLKGANDDITRGDSVELWLSWIKDANYVITDSFHGAVFSILFHRPFNVYMDSWRGNARFISLLNMLACTDRGILAANEANTDNYMDWEVIDSKLSELRFKSISYLKDNIY